MPGRSKKAVVTGCSRGIGRAIAERLVQEGFQVAAVCRRFEDAQAMVQALGPEWSSPIQLDMAQGGPAVRRAASQIQAWLGEGRLDLLVNNAGNSYGGWDDEAWIDSRAVNYQGPVLLTEALLPVLAVGASVVMVGSGLGELNLLSPKFQRLLMKAQSIDDLDKLAEHPIDSLTVEHSWVGPYGLSKAMVHRAAEIFASAPRFTSKHVSVTAVCPGWVSTDMGGEQAPISVEEAAGHILQKGFKSGSFTCFCYKNFDQEHTRQWEQKHGKWEADGQQDQTVCGHGTKQYPSNKRKKNW